MEVTTVANCNKQCITCI